MTTTSPNSHESVQFKICVRADMKNVAVLGQNTPLNQYVFRVLEVDPMVADGVLTGGGPVDEDKDETVDGVIYSYVFGLRAFGLSTGLYYQDKRQTATLTVAKDLSHIKVRIENNPLMVTILQEGEMFKGAQATDDGPYLNVRLKTHAMATPVVRKDKDGDLTKDWGDFAQKFMEWTEFFEDMGIEYKVIEEGWQN